MCDAQCAGKGKLIVANVTKKQGGLKKVHYDPLHSYLQPHQCLNKKAIYV
jgi:hypothetical protein